MKREKLDTKAFKKREKLYNNFVKYFANQTVNFNYEDAKVVLREMVYDRNLGVNSKFTQMFVKSFNSMREAVETSYTLSVSLRGKCSESCEGLIKRLQLKLKEKQIKQTYENFVKFELEFFDAMHISLLAAKKHLDKENLNKEMQNSNQQ